MTCLPACLPQGGSLDIATALDYYTSSGMPARCAVWAGNVCNSPEVSVQRHGAASAHLRNRTAGRGTPYCTHCSPHSLPAGACLYLLYCHTTVCVQQDQPWAGCVRPLVDAGQPLTNGRGLTGIHCRPGGTVYW